MQTGLIPRDEIIVRPSKTIQQAGPCRICGAAFGQECRDAAGRSLGASIHGFGGRWESQAAQAAESTSKAGATIGTRLADEIFRARQYHRNEPVTLTYDELCAALGVAAERGMRRILHRER